MEFGMIGISFQKTKLEIRERVAFTDTKKMELFQKLEQNGVSQSVILSTCNRSEVYFIYESEGQNEVVKECYLNLFSLFDFTPYLIEKQKKEAITYLFEVTSGLRSLVLGEDQILGQTQEAVEFAKQMGYAKKEILKIFRDAITCAKRIKTDLKISEHPLSVSYIGLKMLNRECVLAGKTALVIGSGKMASLTLKYLVEYGAKEIYVCNRSLKHLEELKKEFPDIHISNFEQRYAIIKKCDAVVSATSAPHVVIKKERVEPVDRIRYLLDLATPRDMDREFGEDPSFRLYDIDSLKQMAMENQKEREGLIAQGEKQIALDVKETLEWLKISRMDTTIESLQKRCDEIVEDTFSYLNRKIELNEREKKIVKKTLHASLQKLIHEPIHTLKQLENEKEQNAYREMIAQLFQIS